jgi:ribonuclease T2
VVGISPANPRQPLSRLAALALLAALSSGCDSSSETAAPNTPIAQSQPTSPPPGGKAELPAGSGFDFYVLSLSWSPSYCEAEGQDANRQQCEGGRPYAFVVHGLWPQYERGYPRDCATGEAEVSNGTLRGLYDLMPSAGLIRHQWRKHGSCSGLSQSDYFSVLRKARESVTVPTEFARLEQYRTVAPDDVERSFLQANASLPAAGIAVTCDKRYLREVRICLTKELDFRACDEVDRRSCRISKAVMPPVRGG